MQPQSVPTPMASGLDRAVADHVRVGWTVESRSDTMAVLVSGARINHVLHLLLTLATCGFWGIAWLILALTNKVKHLTLLLNTDGSVTMQKSSA